MATGVIHMKQMSQNIRDVSNQCWYVRVDDSKYTYCCISVHGQVTFSVKFVFLISQAEKMFNQFPFLEFNEQNKQNRFSVDFVLVFFTSTKSRCSTSLFSFNFIRRIDFQLIFFFNFHP